MANIQAELKSFFGMKTQSMFLGFVKPSLKKNATRVIVYHYEMDPWLTAYFRNKKEYYAYDPQKICKIGDAVIIKELPEKKTTLITHEIMKVLFPLGDITCPLTGRKVTTVKNNMPVYRDYLDKIDEAYGKNPQAFKYDEAPPRGWQEGKRDFSNKYTLPVYSDEENYDRYKAIV